MSRISHTDGPRRESGAQADLCRQYRPIGIGAVAAALEAKRDSAETAKTAPSKEQDRQEWQAPRKSFAA